MSRPHLRPELSDLFQNGNKRNLKTDSPHTPKNQDQSLHKSASHSVASNKENQGQEDNYDDDFELDDDKSNKLKLIFNKSTKLPAVGQTQIKSDELSRKFTIIKQIGNGGYASVYLAKSTNNSGRLVAVKQVEKGSSKKEYFQDKIESITTEINILKYLASRSTRSNKIVKFYEFIDTQHSINVILEYAQYNSLRYLYHYTYKSSNGIPETQCVIFIKQVLQGIDFLHCNHIIHKDIKAANILISDTDYNIKICDFGISVFNRNIDQNDLIETTSEGSPYWMSPEIIKLHKIGFRSDVWSIGATLLELLTKTPPFGKSNYQSASHSIGSGHSIPLPYGLVSEQCIDFMQSCLTHDYTKRPGVKTLQNHLWLKLGSKVRDSGLFEALRERDEFSLDEDFIEDEEVINFKLNKGFTSKLKDRKKEDISSSSKVNKDKIIDILVNLNNELLKESHTRNDQFISESCELLNQYYKSKTNQRLLFAAITETKNYLFLFIKLLPVTNWINLIIKDFFLKHPNEFKEFIQLGGFTVLHIYIGFFAKLIETDLLSFAISGGAIKLLQELTRPYNETRKDDIYSMLNILSKLANLSINIPYQPLVSSKEFFHTLKVVLRKDERDKDLQQWSNCLDDAVQILSRSDLSALDQENFIKFSMDIFQISHDVRLINLAWQNNPIEVFEQYSLYDKLMFMSYDEKCCELLLTHYDDYYIKLFNSIPKLIDSYHQNINSNSLSDLLVEIVLDSRNKEALRSDYNSRLIVCLVKILKRQRQRDKQCRIFEAICKLIKVDKGRLLNFDTKIVSYLVEFIISKLKDDRFIKIVVVGTLIRDLKSWDSESELLKKLKEAVASHRETLVDHPYLKRALSE